MLYSLLKLSIQNRVMVVLMTGILVGIGFQSLLKLPIDAVPDITNQQVQINAVAMGLSPVDVEKQVTFPLETALAGIKGLDYTRSLSRNGFSQVTAIFDDEVDIYFARQQVSERITEARTSLPPGIDIRMGPIATGLGEVYMWSVEYSHPEGRGADAIEGQPGWQPDGRYLTPEGASLSGELEWSTYLRTVQDWVIRPILKTVPGVAGVDVIGGYAKQFQVQPDINKLLSYQLTLDDLMQALAQNNTSVGAGYIETQGEAYQVRSDGRILEMQELESILIANRDGMPIYLRDVADIGIGRELRTGAASKNGEEAVIGTALMRINENSRTVSESVDARLKSLGQTLPPDVVIRPVLNRTQLVDATIKTVKGNLLEGACLVIGILFWVLGNLRAALITAAVIPLSMLMTATGMVKGQISGNLMSLGALDFGLIVDGAVIIVENCLRHLVEKQRELKRTLSLEERLDEVILATRQVIQPSVFGQAIIITVYLPILSLTGIEGKMFHPMAMTVIFALSSAFILSLTFVPAMVAMGFGGELIERESPFVEKTKLRYIPLLNQTLAHPRQFLIGALSVMTVSFLLAGFLGQEFIPTLDEKNIAVQAIRIPSASLSQSLVMQSQVEKTLAAFPEVDYVFSKTGTAEMATDPMPPNATDTFVMLKGEEDWPDAGKSKLDLIKEMEEALSLLPGNLYEFTQPIQMRFNELIAGVRGDVAIKVYGDEFSQLEPTAAKIATLMAKVQGAEDIKVEQTSGLPLLSVVIDRGAVARYGLTMSNVQQVIAVALGGRDAGLVFEGDRRFPIMVRLPESARQDLELIRRLPIPLPAKTGKQIDFTVFVPLSEVARIDMAEGQNQVSRENGKRRIVIQMNVRDRDIGSFVQEARQIVESEVKLPAGYWLQWGGQFQNLVKARDRLLVVVPVCLLLILLLLFSAFKTLRHALLILSGIPFALVGGILALLLRDMSFSITSAVGFIALSGVAVLNGLVMVSFINELVHKGMPVREAVLEGAVARLRPVLMTALVAALGFVPMALNTGTGAEVQKPLATVVIGGLMSSTLLTLLLLPLMYFLVESGKPIRQWFDRT